MEKGRWKTAIHSPIVWGVAALAALALVAIGIWLWSISRDEPTSIGSLRDPVTISRLTVQPGGDAA